ncbi:dynamin family protein [Micromonospora sp. CPCC 206060]|uniref:dynamin family protein n=1 Tax=Micromonospora sp. CPCC 206060 TaxID=3122406 RepID=UPI002FF25AEB
MTEYVRIRTDILDLLSELAGIARASNSPTTATGLAAARDRLHDERLRVVFCGEFKSGKSSLVNALLDEVDEPHLVPEAEEIATSTTIVVSYADPEEIVVAVRDPDGTAEAIGIGRDQIRDFATERGNPNNTRDVLLIEAGTPIALLESGLSLVDTPGQGGPHHWHDAATRASLPGADAIVYVLDGEQTVLAGHLDAIRPAAEAVRSASTPGALLFALTKADVADVEEVLPNARAKIVDAFRWLPGQVTIVPVSAHLHREFLRSGDQLDLATGNIPGLLGAIWSALAHRGIPRVLGPALDELETGVRALIDPLAEQAAGLADGSRERLDRARTEAVARRRELDDLRDKGATWRRKLRQRLADVQKELQAYATERLDEVWHRCDTEYLYQAKYLDRPEMLVDRLNADAAQVVGEVNVKAAVATAAVLEEIRIESGLSLTTPAMTPVAPPSRPTDPVTGLLGQDLRSSPFKRKVRDALFGMGVGSSTGLVVGSVVPVLGTAAGMVIGSLAGAVVGWRSGARDVRNEDLRYRRESLTKELAPVRKAQKKQVVDGTKDIVDDLRGKAEAELDRRIAQQRESTEQRISGAESAQRLEREAARARRAELRAFLAPLERLRARIDEVTRAAGALLPGAPGPQDAAADNDDLSWAEA